MSNLNDGTNQAPRLRAGHTLWNLEGLPMNAATPWTLPEKMARVRDAGFEHIECWLQDDEDGDLVRRKVANHGLHFALGHRPMNIDDTRRAVELAARWDAQWVLCQPASAYHSLPEVVQIVREGARIASDLGLRYFVETHRNNYTESLRQTLELIEAVPDIQITADFSHFVVVGEFYGWDGEGALERLQPVIERVAHVHGRISNGEQVQVDVGDGQTDPSARFFVRIWTQIFRTWRQSAKPGDILPFSSELGPPRYAITLPDGNEFSDRWGQSLVMRELALEAWELSNA